MRKSFKVVICVVLLISMLAGMSVCFATTDEKHYRHYDTVVLLGDSVAAGFDEKDWVNTEFVRVDHSYAAVVADTLGAELIPLACQGFRTVEMRYMLEDDFEGDDLLFHDSYGVDATIALIPKFRQSIADADLITLGLGGNDMFTSLAWVVVDEMEKDGFLADYIKAAKELLAKLGVEDNGIEKIIELADAMDNLPAVLEALPKYFARGVRNYLTNWTIILDDIYALNPDVELVVSGMFDTGYKSEDEFDDTDISSVINHKISTAIVESVNAQMKAYADKYGYIYVDMGKIVCYGSHPTPAGYHKMAERILEALPEAEFPYNDVHGNSWCYDAVRYVTYNKLMDGTSDTAFSPNANVTRAQLAEALYRMAGSPSVKGMTEPFFDVTSKTTYRDAIVWAYNNGLFSGIVNGKFFSPNGAVTRANLASVLYRNAGSPAVSGSLKFYDAFTVPSYAKNAVIWASQNGIMNGYANNVFRPLKSATRAEVATVLWNISK